MPNPTTMQTMGGGEGGGEDNTNAGAIQNFVQRLLNQEDGLQRATAAAAQQVLLANSDPTAAPPNNNDAPLDGNRGGMVQRRAGINAAAEPDNPHPPHPPNKDNDNDDDKDGEEEEEEDLNVDNDEEEDNRPGGAGGGAAAVAAMVLCQRGAYDGSIAGVVRDDSNARMTRTLQCLLFCTSRRRRMSTTI